MTVELANPRWVGGAAGASTCTRAGQYGLEEVAVSGRRRPERPASVVGGGRARALILLIEDPPNHS